MYMVWFENLKSRLINPRNSCFNIKYLKRAAQSTHQGNRGTLTIFPSKATKVRGNH